MSAGLSRVTCFDEDAVGWNAQPMFDYMEKHEPEAKKEVARARDVEPAYEDPAGDEA